jgi:hypothetical protein
MTWGYVNLCGHVSQISRKKFPPGAALLSGKFIRRSPPSKRFNVFLLGNIPFLEILGI